MWSIQEHYCIGLISDNSFTLLKKFSASQIFGAKPVFVYMCAPCLKMTTKGKAVKSVIYISSSDEDEEDTPPSKARLPYKVKKENLSNGIVQKTETVVLSSDDELEKTPQKVSRPSVVKEEPDLQVSTSKAQNETSPWKSLKFNQNNMKILQAKVKLQKLNFGNLSNASIDKTENHDAMPVPTASCSKSQVSSSKLRKILLVLPEGKRNGCTYSKIKRFLEGYSPGIGGAGRACHAVKAPNSLWIVILK